MFNTLNEQLFAVKVLAKKVKVPNLGWVNMTEEVRFQGQIKSTFNTTIGLDPVRSKGLNIFNDFNYSFCAKFIVGKWKGK